MSVHTLLGFKKPLSVMLQATSAHIIKAYNNINLVQAQVQVVKKDCDQVLHESINLEECYTYGYYCMRLKLLLK